MTSRRAIQNLKPEPFAAGSRLVVLGSHQGAETLENLAAWRGLHRESMTLPKGNYWTVQRRMEEAVVDCPLFCLLCYPLSFSLSLSEV